MLRFAFRNIWRNKRRTIITLFSVFFSSFLIISFRFLAYGAHEDALQSAVRLSKGFIQVAAHGWLDRKPLERALEVDDALFEKIKVAGVDVMSPRIEGYALASHGSHSTFVSFLAADAGKEKQITDFHTNKIEGKYLHQLPIDPLRASRNLALHRVVIGKILANNLDAGLGDTISLVSTQFDGTVGAILCKVVGIVRTYDNEVDSRRITAQLAAGSELFGLGRADDVERYTSIALGIKDHLTAERVYDVLEPKFPRPKLAEGELAEDSDNYDPIVHFWPELIPGLVQMMEFDDVQNNATWAFLLLVMAFGVVNTVQMSIQERVREFGVLMALGTRQVQLLAMIMLETLWILLPGLLLGGIAAIALGNYFYENPIVFSEDLTEAYSSMGYKVIQMRSIVDMGELWIGVLTLTIPSLLLSWFASRRIFKINPVEAIATY